MRIFLVFNLLTITILSNELFSTHSNHGNFLTDDRIHRVLEIIAQDFEDQIDSSIDQRKRYRCFAVGCEWISGALLYLGTAVSTVASASALFEPDYIKYFSFISTACFAAHVFTIGMAKLSSKETRETDELLNKFLKRIKVEIDGIAPNIVIDQPNSSRSSARMHADMQPPQGASSMQPRMLGPAQEVSVPIREASDSAEEQKSAASR